TSASASITCSASRESAVRSAWVLVTTADRTRPVISTKVAFSRVSCSRKASRMASTVRLEGFRTADHAERRVNSSRQDRGEPALSSGDAGSGRTIEAVDATLAATLGGLLGLVVGAVAAFAFRLSERTQKRVPASQAGIVPPDVATVLGVLGSATVVVG